MAHKGIVLSPIEEAGARMRRAIRELLARRLAGKISRGTFDRLRLAVGDQYDAAVPTGKGE